MKLSETEVDGRVFKRMNLNRNLELEKSVKLKDLSKDLLFITDGYFDFNEMIWKDRSDGRAIKPSQWYQNDLFYLRQIFHFQGRRHYNARFDFGVQAAPGAAVLPEAMLYHIENQPELSYYERSPCIYENKYKNVPFSMGNFRNKKNSERKFSLRFLLIKFMQSCYGNL